jgi:hypothetical protein
LPERQAEVALPAALSSPIVRDVSDADDSSDDEVEDQWVQCAGLDAGGGSQPIELGADWVTYLAETDLPGNVSGVDYGIQDFSEDGAANV